MQTLTGKMSNVEGEIYFHGEAAEAARQIMGQYNEREVQISNLCAPPAAKTQDELFAPLDPAISAEIDARYDALWLKANQDGISSEKNEAGETIYTTPAGTLTIHKAGEGRIVQNDYHDGVSVTDSPVTVVLN